ncbi:MAG: zinc ribbon domain-containing protein [Actinobacteria bacterium]|nr:zinc ribbon domain-containing protein [Actinomycetota bacterium]
MPTYQYACNACSREFEIFQEFSDASLTHCPECQGDVRKVYSAVGVVFKGSGFYKTDSKSSSTPSPAPTVVKDTPAASAPTESKSATTPKSE